MQLVTIQGQEEFVKISKARAEAELLSSMTQKYHIRRIREQLHFDHIILPRLVQYCREEAPRPTVSPVGKGEPKADMQLLQ